jgi:hypothetical protein
MLRLVFAVMAILLVGEPTLAYAQADALPPVDEQGKPGPLTVDQLTAEERALYSQLAPDSHEARQFLHTRGFLRLCKLVVAGTMPPLQLPELPAREDWNRQFLTADEAANVVDVALGMHLVAMMSRGSSERPAARAATDTLPAVGEDGLSFPLTVEQLDASEREVFAGLAPDGDDARRFLYTRGYVRFCRLVVDGSLRPLQLPDLPAEENWDRGFLSEDEGKNIVDVALGMHMVARMTPPAAQ